MHVLTGLALPATQGVRRWQRVAEGSDMRAVVDVCRAALEQLQPDPSRGVRWASFFMRS